MAGERRFDAWNEPATKGDVLTAMIWTQALVRSASEYAAAKATGDKDKILEALKAYNAEAAEFREKIDDIGRLVDGE